MKRCLATVALATVALAAIPACNITGANQDAAVDNGLKYAAKVSASGDMHARLIDCNKWDTDNGVGDGYNSCTFDMGGEIVQLECANYSIVKTWANTGCRIPKPSLAPRQQRR